MTIPRSFHLACWVAVLWVQVATAQVVPVPSPITVADLPDPFPWPPHIFNDDPVALDFTIDLDRLAPLGVATGNGARWFAGLHKQIGDRYGEVEAAQKVALSWEHYGTQRSILPPDHPLLLEAEPWVDRAAWSFYPEVWTWQGGPTPIANLLFALQLGRSWIARGQTAENPETALADYRRTIRLGRLMLQDDVVYIQNLIGIALVRLGAEAFFEHARARRDGATAALAALVIHDCTALRLELTRRFQRLLVFTDFVARVGSAEGKSRTELRLPDERFSTLVETATSDPCRALRIEVVTPLWITSHLGTETQRTEAKTILTDMSEDPDGLVASAARQILDRPLDPDELEAHWRGAVPTSPGA